MDEAWPRSNHNRELTPNDEFGNANAWGVCCERCNSSWARVAGTLMASRKNLNVRDVRSIECSRRSQWLGFPGISRNPVELTEFDLVSDSPSSSRLARHRQSH